MDDDVLTTLSAAIWKADEHLRVRKTVARKGCEVTTGSTERFT